MADVFFHTDAKKLLEGKHLVFFGDSNTRAIYKDTVCLLCRNSLIGDHDLRRKLEPSYSGDILGKHTELNQGRDYEEERSFISSDGNIKVDFYFITKCYAPVLVDIMEDIHLGLREAPDIIYINSTFWDICRWGPNGVNLFKDNVIQLAGLFKSSLPKSTLVIWATALPVSHNVQSSLLIKQIDFLRHSLRFDVLEANQFARQVMGNHGFDVLDNHYFMRTQIHRRVKDGVHYQPLAIRLLTNLLLTHIALSWDFPLPNRVKTIALDRAKAICSIDRGSLTPEPSSPPTVHNKRKPPPPRPGDDSSPKNNTKKKASPINRKWQQNKTHNTYTVPHRVKSVNRRRNWNEGSSNRERYWPESTQMHPPHSNMRPRPPVWEPGKTPYAEDVWSGGDQWIGRDQWINQVGNVLGNEDRFSVTGYTDNRVGPNYLLHNLAEISESLRRREAIDKLRLRYAPY